MLSNVYSDVIYITLLRFLYSCLPDPKSWSEYKNQGEKRLIL